MSLLKKIVEKKKSEKYAWPEGWMSREQAANDLGVAPRDVDDTLKEAIRDGDVEKQFFGVWDSRQNRVIRLPGYRVAGADKSTVSKPVSKAPLDGEHDRLVRALRRDPSKSDYVIAKNHRSTTGRVAEVRASLGL